MKTGNELIAEYMKFVDGGNYWASPGTPPYLDVDGSHRFYPSELLFHESMAWLYPVYIKLRKELIQWTDQFVGNTDEEVYAYHKSISIRQAIVDALIEGSIPDLHSEIVKGITFLNEHKKS